MTKGDIYGQSCKNIPKKWKKNGISKHLCKNIHNKIFMFRHPSWAIGAGHPWKKYYPGCCRNINFKINIHPCPRIVQDPWNEILPKRGQCLLSYGDDKYKDKDKDTRNSENNVFMYTGLNNLCILADMSFGSLHPLSMWRQRQRKNALKTQLYAIFSYIVNLARF